MHVSLKTRARVLTTPASLQASRPWVSEMNLWRTRPRTECINFKVTAKHATRRRGCGPGTDVDVIFTAYSSSGANSRVADSSTQQPGDTARGL